MSVSNSTSPRTFSAEGSPSPPLLTSTPESSPEKESVLSTHVKGSFVIRANSIIGGNHNQGKRPIVASRECEYKKSLDKVKSILQQLNTLCLDRRKNADLIIQEQNNLTEASESLNQKALSLVTIPHELEEMMKKDAQLVVEIFSEANNFKGMTDEDIQQTINDLVEEACKTSENKTRISQIICELIRKDVANSDSEGTLFRSDSIRLKLYIAFQAEMMKKIMLEVVCCVMIAIKNNSSSVNENQTDFPNKADMVTIQSLTSGAISKLIEQLESHLSPIPKEMSIIYRTLAKSITEKYPRVEISKHVTSLLFLRGINPALINPQRLGLNMSPTPSEKNFIRAVSIALQDVANNATEKKGKWDDALKISFVPAMQFKMNQVSRALQR